MDQLNDIIKNAVSNHACLAFHTARAGDVASRAAALPKDVAIHDLEHLLPERTRFRGTFKTHSPEDFVNYSKSYADNGAEAFIDSDAMTATTILNLGNLTAPGHADSQAILKLKETAAYTALNSIDGSAKTQQALAEWCEDWRDHLSGRTGDDQVLTSKQVVAALRRVTIKATGTAEHTEGHLEGSRSLMENVEASSGSERLPAFILFDCQPYSGLAQRTFAMRLSLKTVDSKVLLTLRLCRPEQHTEEMAEEFASMLQEHLGNELPVTIGTFSA